MKVIATKALVAAIASPKYSPAAQLAAQQLAMISSQLTPDLQ